MLLRRLQIDNFRAIRSIDLELDETVALIGENGSGKTSIFDALEACLGVRHRGPALQFERHHFRPLADSEDKEAIDEIRVRLHFGERETGEWPESQRERLAPALFEGPGGKLGILWEVTARWDAAAAQARPAWRFLGSDGQPLDHAGSDGLVAELRRLNPFLVFGANGQWNAGEEGLEMDSAERLLAVGGDDLEQTAREIFGKLSEGWDSLSAKEMRQARAAARRIWKRLTHLKSGSWAVKRKPDVYRLPSGGAQSLGPLLVFGSLLQARGARPLEADVEPIIGGDHIGAMLHPATLGSVWHVMESLPVQKIVSTYSGELVSAMPLAVLRRLVRRRKGTDVYRFHPHDVQPDELRRLGYHIRARRGGALFDRCWLLVEGETEFWLLPEMARFSGYRFDAEGVSVVEFAQCGLDPIVKLARQLGISWHLLADGDDAGNDYVNAAAAFLDGDPFEKHITQLPDGDIEQHLWSAGYSEVYIQAIRAKRGHRRRDRRNAIQRAVNAHSKPFLALSVLTACARPDSPGVPPVLKQVIDKTVLLARSN